MKIGKLNLYSYSLNTSQRNKYQSTMFGISAPYYKSYYSVCFKGKDLLELSEDEVFKKIKESLNYENFLGQGTEAEVYRIKDTNYCVRIPHITQDMYTMDYSKELSPIDKVNHTKIKLGFGATVMPYFEGVIPKDYQNNEYQRFKLQEKIADMPIKSYTDLLHQIANGIDNEMFFDFSGGNLIINTEKNKLTAIDFYSITDDPRPIKPLTEMYSVLTAYGSKKDTGKKIYDKIVETGLEEFKPDKIPCMDVKLFDFADLASFHHSKCATDKNYAMDIRDFLVLKHNITETNKELKQVKKLEILNKISDSILNENILKLKSLMLKVH